MARPRRPDPARLAFAASARGTSRWLCALVSLPSEGNDTSLAWFRDVADLVVLPERRRWCIVNPVPYELDLDGRVQLEANQWTCLAFHPGDSDEDSTVAVHVGGEDSTLILSGRRWHLLEVATQARAEPSLLHFRWDLHDLPILIRRPLDACPVAVVDLEFKSASQDGSRAALHGRRKVESFWIVYEPVNANLSDSSFPDASEPCLGGTGRLSSLKRALNWHLCSPTGRFRPVSSRRSTQLCAIPA